MEAVAAFALSSLPLAIAALFLLLLFGWGCRQWLRRRGRAEATTSAGEMLALEGGHRVTDTLQMILSLLRLHEGRVRRSEEDPATAAEALRAAEERISAIAIVHRQLHEVAQAGSADMRQLLWSVADSLIASANLVPPAMAEVRCAPAVMPDRYAVPLALVVSEWTTHRLAGRPPPGLIRIDLETSEGLHTLQYVDDGPAWDDRRDDDMLHGEVVSAILRQLSGTLIRAPGSGARIRLSFAGPLEPPPAPE